MTNGPHLKFGMLSLESILVHCRMSDRSQKQRPLRDTPAKKKKKKRKKERKKRKKKKKKKKERKKKKKKRVRLERKLVP